jgi:hypothetical protein
MSDLLNTSLKSSVETYAQSSLDAFKPISDAQIAAAPMVSATSRTTAEIKELHETIRLQIEATNKQSKVITRLTWAAVFLGSVQVIGMVVQIWISIKQ